MWCARRANLRQFYNSVALPDIGRDEKSPSSRLSEVNHSLAAIGLHNKHQELLLGILVTFAYTIYTFALHYFLDKILYFFKKALVSSSPSLKACF